MQERKSRVFAEMAVKGKQATAAPPQRRRPD
jgi:hypothetical protein